MTKDPLGISPEDISAAARLLVTGKAPPGVVEDSVSIEIGRFWTIEPNENFGLKVYTRHKALGHNGIHVGDDQARSHPDIENRDTQFQMSARVWFPEEYNGGVVNAWQDTAFQLLDGAFAAERGEPLDLEAIDQALRGGGQLDVTPFLPIRERRHGGDEGRAYLAWVVSRLESGAGLDLQAIRLISDNDIAFNGDGRLVGLPIVMSLNTARVVMAELGDEAFLQCFDAGILRAARSRDGGAVMKILKGEVEIPRFMSTIRVNYGDDVMKDVIRPRLETRPFAPVDRSADASLVLQICRAELLQKESPDARAHP